MKDKALARAVWALFRRANEHVAEIVDSGADMLVVLVSRRLSCLYEMVLATETGPELFKGADVISDRALEGNPGRLSDRSVLLLDDSLILGSTLVNLFDKIDRMTGGRGRVRAMVACVDRERHNPALARHLGLLRKGIWAEGVEVRPTEDLELFSYDVASSLYRSGTPYFMDFPLVRPHPVTKRTFDAYLRSTRWLVAEVTPPPAFRNPGQAAYSLIPSAELSDRIRRRGLSEAMAVAELFKVRLYLTSHRSSWKLRVVPIGIPGPMTESRLDEILAAMEDLMHGVSLRCQTWKAPAKHRLVQMYLSSCVLAEWWSEADEALGLDSLTGESLDHVHLTNYFGAEDALVVVDAFTTAVEHYVKDPPADDVPVVAPFVPRSGLGSRPEVRARIVMNAELVTGTSLLGSEGKLDLLSSAVPPARPGLGERVEVDHIWAHRVLQVFGFIDDRLERPQEQALKRYSYKAYAAYRDKDGDDRIGPRILQQGITLSEIAGVLMPEVIPADPWESAVVSLAVDIGNDLGIIVPTTTFDKRSKAVYRQYRSGETAFVARTPHEELAGIDHRSVGAAMDVFTRSVLADPSSGKLPAVTAKAFAAENSLLAEEALPDLTVAQAWLGEVIEVEDEHVRADVMSLLDEGETDVALLPLYLFGPSASAVIAGSVFRWLVFEDRTPAGWPRPVPQVRLLGGTPTF